MIELSERLYYWSAVHPSCQPNPDWSVTDNHAFDGKSLEFQQRRRADRR